ncbi:MAG: CBS domain-containing protein [Deltaproteobacteria bacterium]|nr:CBS domain-containing protein [Deltaproteobacteria bacterium]
MPLSARVWDYMDRKFKTIHADASLAEAMEAMADVAKTIHNRSLVVVDHQNRPLGVIAMRNVLEAFRNEFITWHGLLGKTGWQEAMEKGLKECHYRKVEDFMVKVPALRMNDDLLKAYTLLTDRKIRLRIAPVVEADEVVGVIRIPELFDAFLDAFRKTC